MRILHTLLFVLFTASAMAGDKPYDETADAKGQIKQALAEAATNQMPIILVFGANWCPDCLVLDMAMKKGASASLLTRDFKIVKIDVGQKDKNLDVAQPYGVPVTNGIPAVVIISPRNEVLYATKEGELSNAQKMGERGIYEFFKRVTEEARAKKGEHAKE
jgi:thioredoxin 1